VSIPADARKRIEQALAHLGRVLPAQAPIRDFVHHNTLHGFQHLPFPQALSEARKLTGIRGYLPEAQFRRAYTEGRIADEDIDAVLREAGIADDVLIESRGGALKRLDAQRAALLHAVEPLTWPQLQWRIGELQATACLQRSVSAAARLRLIDAARADGCEGEAAAVADLWAACLEACGLSGERPHPEGLPTEGADARVQARRAAALWRELAGRLGAAWTLRSLIQALSGEDILDALRPAYIRALAAQLDQGLAAWRNPRRGDGLFAAWRAGAAHDAAAMLGETADLRRELADYPEDALDAIAFELDWLGLPRARWAGYLERLALEVPGWSGMLQWRAQRPGYAGADEAPLAIADALALRLLLDRAHAEAVTRRLWGLAPRLGELEAHFRRHPAELIVRHARQAGGLPEYLQDAAGRLLAGAEDDAWEALAARIADWQGEHAAGEGEGRSVAGSAWPLFVLAQHLGLSGGELRAAGLRGVEALADCIERFDEDARGFLWLQAYERRYREQIFSALAANHGRAAPRRAPPEAQLVFCMDDREEGLRRHLEETNPRLETLGAAAHFGVFQNWRGLDDDAVTPLCPVVPVVVRPAHAVDEVPRPQAERRAAVHRRRFARRRLWRERLHQLTRRGFFLAPLLTALAAPFALLALLLNAFAPAALGRRLEARRLAADVAVPTRLTFSAPADSAPATPEAPRAGFTDREAAERVVPFLRAMGLADGFAPLVVILGHGSNSSNNPHLAAYDCGACAGRHSGPNARLFAAMANRPEVRALMAEQGVAVPEGTWFLGAEHNTCDDSIAWYDPEDVPQALRPALAKLRGEFEVACRLHAQERCRRLASAPLGMTPEAARRHVAGRRHDFSQARPELGHATNACALIGRRAMSRGAFFDRRSFLISYDPALDADGAILERLLLANGPVGAGIALEYYFSTVNNERYGCGSKIVHNVAGYFGVMEGVSSDLRTGLPLQMIEIHEAMRLLVVVEAKTGVVTAIYRRQPPLQELIGKGWIVVAAKDPDAPAIHLFDPARGWLPWQGAARLPTVAASRDWFAGKREPLAPVLLKRPVEASA